MSELAEIISRHCPDGTSLCAIPGLTLANTPASSTVSLAVPPPLFCVIAKGRKRIRLGEEEFFYDSETYLLTSADLPVAGEVLEDAIGLSLELKPALLAEVLVQFGLGASDPMSERAVGVSRLNVDLLDSVTRLVRLLDEPEHIAGLAPLAEREIYYRLLMGPRAPMLRQLALPNSHLSSIRLAIEHLRRRYDQAIRVEELAEVAAMSSPTFHRHFRSVTGMSPLQYQKRLRLHEARRRLLSENSGASAVAFEVGYESPSQFNREYRRMFGAPPIRETSEARQAVLASVPNLSTQTSVI